jgi:hypothetical protein
MAMVLTKDQPVDRTLDTLWYTLYIFQMTMIWHELIGGWIYPLRSSGLVPFRHRT